MANLILWSMKKKLIELDESQLEGNSLFLKKIYCTQVTLLNEENKLIKFNTDLQCEFMSLSYTVFPISKTINKKIFVDVKSE